MDEAPSNGHAPHFKIPPVRVPADDCPTQATDGERLYLHEGEWVEIVPIPDYQMLIALRRMAASTDDLAYDRLCERMARRVTAWSLSDVDGEPLPQPWRNPDAIRDLGIGEHMWLLGILESGGREARKNGLRAVGRYLHADGPQPPEAMISIICREFTCTPDVALRQDPRLVRAIMDYRRLAEFEANSSDPDRVIDWDEMTFADEVRALAGAD